MQENFLLKFQVFLFFSTIDGIFVEQSQCGRVAEGNGMKFTSSILTFASFLPSRESKCVGRSSIKLLSYMTR